MMGAPSGLLEELMLARMGQPADRAAVLFAASVVGEPRCWLEALKRLGELMEGVGGD